MTVLTVWARTLLLLLLAALLAACGSGATKGPGGDTPDTDGGTATTRGAPDDPDDPERFEFNLPVGDTGVQAYEVRLYESLRSGNCDQTQRLLDGDGSERPWQALSSQRDVLLFQAGIALCRGDEDAAREWLALLAAEDLRGVDSTKNLCQLYQANASVLAQEPAGEFDCPGGEAPGWPEEGEFGRDDPRTTEDEGTIPPSPSPEDEVEPSDTPPSTPSDEGSPGDDSPVVPPDTGDGGTDGDQSPE